MSTKSVKIFALTSLCLGFALSMPEMVEARPNINQLRNWFRNNDETVQVVRKVAGKAAGMLFKAGRQHSREWGQFEYLGPDNTVLFRYTANCSNPDVKLFQLHPGNRAAMRVIREVFPQDSRGQQNATSYLINRACSLS